MLNGRLTVHVTLVRGGTHTFSFQMAVNRRALIVHDAVVSDILARVRYGSTLLTGGTLLITLMHLFLHMGCKNIHMGFWLELGLLV